MLCDWAEGKRGQVLQQRHDRDHRQQEPNEQRAVSRHGSSVEGRTRHIDLEVPDGCRFIAQQRADEGGRNRDRGGRIQEIVGGEGLPPATGGSGSSRLLRPASSHW